MTNKERRRNKFLRNYMHAATTPTKRPVFYATFQQHKEENISLCIVFIGMPMKMKAGEERKAGKLEQKVIYMKFDLRPREKNGPLTREDVVEIFRVNFLEHMPKATRPEFEVLDNPIDVNSILDQIDKLLRKGKINVERHIIMDPERLTPTFVHTIIYSEDGKVIGHYYEYYDIKPYITPEGEKEYQSIDVLFWDKTFPIETLFKL